MAEKRALYNGAYRSTLEEPDTQLEEPNKTTSSSDPDTSTSPEESTWRKRYGDLRTHSTQQNERIKSLETQLQAANRQEVKIPSTKEELETFAHKYPDVFRHIRSIAMAELLKERQNIVTETETVRQDLEKVQRELGYKKIISKHPDFEDLNASQEFHDWATAQPKQIQDWLFESTDPDLCVRAIDLYKAEKEFMKKTTKPRSNGADTLVKTKNTPDVSVDGNNKRIWKASDIAKLHPKMYEKMEDEIELARLEDRIDMNA